MAEASERQARSLALEKAYVHQVYQQITSAADSLPDRGRAWPRVKQFLSDLEPGSLICDVGCGNGKYLNVNPSVFKVGGDRCKRLAEVARDKEHEVLICDNLSLPFRDESFDAVLSIAVVHHFATTDRRVQALKELARVLRIGGKLIITVWAMEQRHRKFESQDVLVPWHRPQHLSTPSLEFTSTTTTTSEEDGAPPYHAYTQTSDSESARSQRTNNGLRKRGRSRHKGRSIDPGRPVSSSQSSSSLSSPNETCYSFVRRALQKLAGGKRGGSGRHRPWFLESPWSTCTKDPPPRRYDPEGCEDIDVEDIQDLPIELRRLEEESDFPQRRQTFACSERLSTSVDITLGYKSKSLSDILTVNQKRLVRSCSSVPSLDTAVVEESKVVKQEERQQEKVVSTVITSQPKPKLVKQKQSLCEEDLEEEGGDEPTDMRDLVKRLPEFKVSISGGGRRCGSVFKQSSMNEELMSTERLREKERVRKNIQKQTSLNEEFLFRRQRTLDSIRDTIFSTSTAKRFQLLKDGLTSKIKSSTTGIEKVAGASFKNGFVRILQGWKSETQPSRTTPPTPPPHEVRRANTFEEKNGNGQTGERRHSKEDGSDSSKDSSLQSDTSVDSEDSFASVIFIPKPNLSHANSENSPPNNTSPPNVCLSSPTMQSPQATSPKLKNSLPTSPKFKFQTPTSPIMKQPSLPCKYQAPTSPNFKSTLPTSPIGLTKQHSLPTSPKFKYQMPPLSPGFLKQNDSKPSALSTPPKTPEVLAPHVCVEPEVTAPSPPTPAPTPHAPTAPAPPAEPELKPPEPEPKPAEKPSPHDTSDIVKPKEEAKTSEVAKPKGTRPSFPLVRRSASAAAGASRQDPLTKPLPKLMSLELFNPETDDVDSDSSGVSSPDSVSSVISVLTEELSAESHDAQHTKPSPSDGQSNSNSIHDSDLNLSDQSISSLPNSKSPELLISKSPEQPKSSESSSRSSETSSHSKAKSNSLTGLTKMIKSPEYYSSSYESLPRSPETHKETDMCEAVQKPKVPERSSSKSPEIMRIRASLQRQTSKEGKRAIDERFVTSTCETMKDTVILTAEQTSPSKTLLEAAADVASSLEGAVDAVIQSSPRARRRQKETVHPFKVIEAVDNLEDDFITDIFKKCEGKQSLHQERKKSSEMFSLHQEPYPDFEFCKVKFEDELTSNTASSLESMPLLSSVDHGSSHSLSCYDSDPDPSCHERRQRRKKLDQLSSTMEAGSSWSLGRSEKFRSSLLAVEKRQKNPSTWSLNRYDTIAKIPCGELQRTTEPTGRRGLRQRHCDDPWDGALPERPIVRIIHEDLSVSTPKEEAPVNIRQRRNFRSHSLSLYNTERLTDIKLQPWDEECRQHLAECADRLSESLLEEIDQYRDQGADARSLFSSLPACLEHMDDPYLTKLSEELMDLTKLSAELKERNNYLASLSDEDLNRELNLSKPETNPFLSISFKNESSSNPFSSNLERNPFLTDPNDPDFDPFTTDGTGVGKSNSLNFDDSFVPFEVDSPPNVEVENKIEKAMSEVRTVEGSEAVKDLEPVLPFKHATLERCQRTRGKRSRAQNLLFIKSASLDDSHKFLLRSNGKPTQKTEDVDCDVKKAEQSEVKGETVEGVADVVKPIIAGCLGQSTESSDPDISLESRNTRVSSLECSMEIEPNIQRDTSKVTIASSLGHSMESSDHEASGGTGSGSECSRRDMNRITTSTASLGHSMESSDPGDVSERTGSGSDFSRKETSSAGTGRTAGSTASLGPESGSDCSRDARYADRRSARCDGRSSSEETPRRVQLIRQKAAIQEPLEAFVNTESFETSLNGSTSQESLPSDNGGGAITFHRYYHVFKEGELDQLIEKYVDNLHIISSYYDHANWCVIAEKVHVWTI